MGYKLVREMRRRKLKFNEMAVWTALGDHARDDGGGMAYPSQETLARETGYTGRQVRNILRRLEKRGAIVEVKRPGRRTTRTYRIHLEAFPLAALDNNESRPEEFSGLNDTPGKIKTGKNCHQDRKNLHQDRKNSAFKTGKVFHQTPMEPEINPKRARARVCESRDIGEDSEPARAFMPARNSNEEKSKEGEPDRFRRGCDEVPITIDSISNQEVIEKREKKRRLLREQAKISLACGITTVDAPPGKYSEG